MSRTSFLYILGGFIFCWGALLLFAQVPAFAAQIEIEKSLADSDGHVPSGSDFSFIIQYRCASITQDCTNVVITDVVPPELSREDANVRLTTSDHVQSRSYDPNTGTATWTLVNPLPAGTTGEVRLVVEFPRGITLDGTEAINQATIDASNATSQTSDPVSVTADAENRMFARKTLMNGDNAPISNGSDDVTMYRLQLCNPSDGASGGLNMSDITFTDDLPSGAIFVDASGEGELISPGRVQWVISQDTFSAANGTCLTRYLTVRYPNPPFDEDSANVTNELEVRGTSANGQTQTVTTTESHGFEAPIGAQQFEKAVDHPYALQGDQIRYGFWIDNTGNTALSNYTITDTIPAALQVDTLWIGRGDFDTTVTIQYQTNLNSSWQSVPGGAIDVSSGSTYSIAVNTLDLDSGEYLTSVRWIYATLPVNYDAHDDNLNNRTGLTATILTTDRNGNPVSISDVISNTAQVTYTYNGSTGDSDSDTVTVSVSNGPSPNLHKVVPDNAVLVPGEEVNTQLILTNTGSGQTALLNPSVGDLLPVGLEYVTGSWSMTDTAGSAPNPTLTVTENYLNTGRIHLKWSWGTSNPLTLVGGSRTITISFRLRVAPGTLQGTLSNTGTLISYSNDGINTDACDTLLTDTNDIDNDGNITEALCSTDTVEVTVAPLALLSSEKLVQGQLDTSWSKYPRSGRTIPGGTIDYRLRITNDGNIPMDQIIIADVLPIPDDTGLIDEQPRQSIWRPTFETLTSVPEGATVVYSTTNDPCLPELSLPTDTCENPQWESTPLDMDQVRSLRFSLNSYILQPGTTIELRMRLRAPSTGLPEFGSITWNSFAYIARWADGSNNMVLASEPIKVGVALEASLADTGETLVVPGLVVGTVTIISWLTFSRRHRHTSVYVV